METKLTYSFKFSLSTFSLNLLTESEADKVNALLLSYNNFSDKFYFGISCAEENCLEGILQISENDFRELWRFVLILVKEYLGKDYLHR